ncbi:hypothetical protein [Brasilonema sp. UFV-L1]|uniref:hypothetical protein n=1 Tax=Brasilonema sp. UFV-L1 TaxID=2234130 RepID=UPI00145F76A5|nr:hypothetical protein [Brasilonema sp. UFV-L1]
MTIFFKVPPETRYLKDTGFLAFSAYRARPKGTQRLGRVKPLEDRLRVYRNRIPRS